MITKSAIVSIISVIETTRQTMVVNISSPKTNRLMSIRYRTPLLVLIFGSVIAVVGGLVSLIDPNKVTGVFFQWECWEYGWQELSQKNIKVSFNGDIIKVLKPNIFELQYQKIILNNLKYFSETK